MKRPTLIPSQDRTEAFTAAMLWALAWITEVMRKLGAPRRSRMLLRAVRFCEDRVECVLFLQAARLCRLTPRRRSLYAPRRRGFRRARPHARLLLRAARIRAPRGAAFHDRIARLLDALARPEPFIARFIARIRKGLRGVRFIPRAPADDTRIAFSAAAPRFADSS